MLEINKIYQGDCLELMKQINDNSIDMILCDLPYGTIEQEWDDVNFNYLDCFLQYRRIIKSDGCIAIMLPILNALEVLSQNKDIFKYDLVWNKPNKTNFANAKNKPLREHENIFIFSLGTTANGSDRKMKYFPQGLVRIDKQMEHNSNRKTPSFMGIRNNYQGNEYIQEYTNYPSTILETTSKEIGMHPTQKPVQLFEYLIKTYTNEDDIVLDSCAGSGTTGLACKNIKRNFILMEKEKKYVDIANKRLNLSTLPLF